MMSDDDDFRFEENGADLNDNVLDQHVILSFVNRIGIPSNPVFSI
jgi:hypothetical protein